MNTTRKRGRPLQSPIRQNMVDLLAILGSAYAYDLYKSYVKVFSKASMRSIYYHLKKGVGCGEFLVKDVAHEKGDYSWGNEAVKIYYMLGPQAKPRPNNRIIEILGKQP